MALRIVPCTIAEANSFIEQLHRHHGRTCGGKFAVAVADYVVHGVALVGMPVARMLNDGWTLEVTRVATDGTKNACSKLYAACWRIAREMGFKKLVTYILDTEPGTSLRAAGWKEIGKAGGGSWNRPSRPRVDKHPTQRKIRYQIEAGEKDEVLTAYGGEPSFPEEEAVFDDAELERE